MPIQFDFQKIDNIAEFYDQFAAQFDLPEYFGRNLDALYDVVSGDLKLPLSIHLINLDLAQLEEYAQLIATFKDLDQSLDDFSFRYSIRGITGKNI